MCLIFYFFRYFYTHNIFICGFNSTCILIGFELYYTTIQISLFETKYAMRDASNIIYYLHTEKLSWSVEEVVSYTTVAWISMIK